MAQQLGLAAAPCNSLLTTICVRADPGSSYDAYSHWGSGKPAAGGASCAAAAAGLAYGLGNAWGWSDLACGEPAVYMCRTPGERPGAPLRCARMSLELLERAPDHGPVGYHGTLSARRLHHGQLYQPAHRRAVHL